MDLLLGAARRCWWSDPGRDARILVATTATSLAGDQSHPTLQSVLAFAAPDTHGAVVRANLAGLSRAPGLDAVQLTYLGIAGTILGAFERSRVLFAAAVPQLREQGRLGLLVRALNHDAFNCVYACQWADAVTVSDECERVASRAGQHRWIALAKVPVAVVAALHGDDARAERLSSEAQQVLLPAATGSAIALLQTGRTYAALGRRDYHEAYKQLLRVYDPADPAYNHLLRMYHIGDLADAASHSGHHDEARELMDEITAGATEEPGPLLSVSLTFARAMLAPDEDAGTAFEQALTEDLRRWPFHYARLKLEYGSWLRHHRRPTQSREHLRTARDILDALGAVPWRNRADAELRAGGEHRRSEPPLASRFDQLTPQEQQIARMVVSGLSNREIAARLSVSHRTVGYHLYRMFPKLGITSRAEVGTVLAEADELTAS
jgi:DNA-binding CsgD family transcriptional regulator